MTLVDGSATYAHVDPIAAYPQNDFVSNLVPFLRRSRGQEGQVGQLVPEHRGPAG